MSNVKIENSSGSESLPPSDHERGIYWGKSKPNITKLSYTWRIQNFSALWWSDDISKSSELLSPPFPNDESKQQWNLKLHVNNDVEEYNEFFGVFLIPLYKDSGILRASCRLYVPGGEETKYDHKLECNRFIPDPRNKTYAVWGFPKYIPRDFLLQKDMLTICCELQIFSNSTGIISGQIPGCPPELPVDPNLCKEWAKLLKSGRLSDVNLVVGGEKLKAHKLVLSARSSVFAAMFQHEMKENELNEVEITDMNEETVKEMLRFIYTGILKKLDKLGEELLVAADKYELNGLKDACERFLISKITVDQVANLLVLADLHSAENMKKEVLKFIRNDNVKNVMETEG